MLLHNFRRVTQAIDGEFEHQMKGALTYRNYVLMVSIGDNPGASAISHSEQTGIDRSTLSAMVGGLLRRKLVQRVRSKSDARAYSITLTDAGRELMEEASRVAPSVVNTVLCSVSNNERKALDSLLCRIVKHSGAAEARKAA